MGCCLGSCRFRRNNVDIGLINTNIVVARVLSTADRKINYSLEPSKFIAAGNCGKLKVKPLRNGDKATFKCYMYRGGYENEEPKTIYGIFRLTNSDLYIQASKDDQRKLSLEKGRPPSEIEGDLIPRSDHFRIFIVTKVMEGDWTFESLLYNDHYWENQNELLKLKDDLSKGKRAHNFGFVPEPDI